MFGSVVFLQCVKCFQQFQTAETNYFVQVKGAFQLVVCHNAIPERVTEQMG